MRDAGSPVGICLVHLFLAAVTRGAQALLHRAVLEPHEAKLLRQLPIGHLLQLELLSQGVQLRHGVGHLPKWRMLRARGKDAAHTLTQASL